MTEPADPAAASLGTSARDRRQKLRDRRDEIVVRQEQPRGIEIALHESRAALARASTAARSQRESTPMPAHGAAAIAGVQMRGMRGLRVIAEACPEKPAQAR